MEYRIRESGAILTQGEVRKLYANISFPAVWDQTVCDEIGIDPILASPQPSPDPLSTVFADGVAQDSLGNWVEKWSLRPMFSEYTDEEGGLHSREGQEQAFLTKRNEDQWKAIRDQRNKNLSECDWTQLTDSPLDALQKTEWATYRQGLRDITSSADPFNITWPTKP